MILPQEPNWSAGCFSRGRGEIEYKEPGMFHAATLFSRCSWRLVGLHGFQIEQHHIRLLDGSSIPNVDQALSPPGPYKKKKGRSLANPETL